MAEIRQDGDAGPGNESPAEGFSAEERAAIKERAAEGCRRKPGTGSSSCSSRAPRSSRHATRRSASTSTPPSTTARWPTSYALTELTEAEEAAIAALVRRAAA
jgi:hypothetical protein